MRVAVFGAGAVGGFFGAQLVRAGAEVVFIARGQHLHAIRGSGLVVESAAGEFVVYPAAADADPATVGPVDVVLLGVKAWQVAGAAEAMRPLVGARTVVIPMQNGVEAADQLREALGEEHVAGGLCRISSHIAGPGRIRHVGMEPYIAFNWFDGHPDSRLEALRDAFTTQGITAEIPEDIQAAIWRKFVFIAPLSGVGAVTRAPVGVQRSVPETRRMLEAAIQEVAEVGRAQGVKLPSSVAQDTLATMDSIPPGTIASMQRDIVSGVPSELDYQTGSVVRLGRARGVPTPTHDFLYASLLPLERRARGEIAF